MAIANMPHSITGIWNVVHRMRNERAWLESFRSRTVFSHAIRDSIRREG